MDGGLIERRRTQSIPEMLRRAFWYLPRVLWLSLPASWRVLVYKKLIEIGDKRYPHHGLSRYAIRIPFGMYAKRTTDTVERDALAFVYKYTTIPIPRVLDFVKDPTSQNSYLIMSRVEGEQLGSWIMAPEHPDTSMVINDLKDALSQLRDIPAPTPMVSGLYSRHLLCPRLSQLYIGPFADIPAFHEYLFTVVHAHADHDALRRLALRSHTKPHRLTFTHGDLNHTNILVAGGRLSGIVDWRTAGWLPEYWDKAAALWHGKRWARVERLIEATFPSYDQEMEVERALWKETDRWS